MPLDVRDWGQRPYSDSLSAMRALHAERRKGAVGDTLILVEHPAVVTVGVQGAGNDPLPEGIEVVAVERGGRATYHGPGQLVGYPIVDLDPRGRDVRRFVREVEATIVDALASVNVRAGTVEGQHGVWVDGARKIASIGIAVEGWVTFHGFALNVGNDLGPFRAFRPCGLSGDIMTSVSEELHRPVGVESLKGPIVRAWSDRFDAPPNPPAGLLTAAT